MIKFTICFFKQRHGSDFCWSDHVSLQRGYLAKKKQGQKFTITIFSYRLLFILRHAVLSLTSNLPKNFECVGTSGNGECQHTN